MSRSAIVVPVRLPAAIARIRIREVEVARLGVPAHVTILSPFLDSDAIDAEVRATIEGIAARVAPFVVAFRTVRRWPASELGHGVVWLEPEPAAPFVELTRTVWAAYPDHPPYGQPEGRLEAHLTIAIDDPTRFDAAEAAVRPHLPFSRQVSAFALLREVQSGRWRTAARFDIGRTAG